MADAGFLAWLEGNLDALLGLDAAALTHAIRRSCEIKAGIVAEDEHEHGRRALLNLGHTFGHAIETAAGYGAWLHGEAVGAGMLMAADLSARLGWLGPADVERVRSLLQRAGLPVAAPRIGAARALELMGMDKKVLAGRIRLVLLRRLGEGVVAGDYPADALQATLAAHFGAARVSAPGTARALRPARRGLARPALSRAAAAAPHRVPARPRPHRALHGLPPPGLQDPGVRQPRGRPVPHAAHALARGGADRAQRGARAGAERAARRGDLPRARPRPHAVRPRRPGRAQRVHARVRRLRAQPAVAARGGRARGALRRVCRAEPHASRPARASSSTAPPPMPASSASSASASSSGASPRSRRSSPTWPTRSPTTTTTSTTACAPA